MSALLRSRGPGGGSLLAEREVSSPLSSPCRRRRQLRTLQQPYTGDWRLLTVLAASGYHFATRYHYSFSLKGGMYAYQVL